MAMYRSLVNLTTIIGLSAALMMQAPTAAQEHHGGSASHPEEETEEVKETYFEVWGTGTREPNRERPWSQSFDSELQAQARLKELERDYASGGLMESEPDKPKNLRVTKLERTVKRMKKAKETLDHRKAGDTLREYAQDVAQAYERVKKFKEQRLAETKNLSKKQIDEVNAQIASFNKTRDNYGDLSRDAVGPILLRYPAMTLLSGADSEKKGKGETGKYSIWVFKSERGKWVRQEDRTLSTDDEAQAKSYVKKVKSYPGWTATSNLPESRKEDPVQTFVGTWTGTNTLGVGKSYASVDPVTYVIKDDHTGVTTFRQSPSSFTWTEEGNTITMTFDNGYRLPLQLMGRELRVFTPKDPNHPGSDDMEIVLHKH
jgi:hypothetical protein